MFRFCMKQVFGIEKATCKPEHHYYKFIMKHFFFVILLLTSATNININILPQNIIIV